MVDVTEKSVTSRRAIARGSILLGPAIMEAVVKQKVKKGDVLAVARVAGIMAAKNTPNAIPLCHPLSLTGCEIDFRLDQDNNILSCQCIVTTDGKTGVEMEALSGVTGALLSVYDMCKAIDKGMVIGPVTLVEKSGGKSGLWRAKESKGSKERKEV